MLITENDVPPSRVKLEGLIPHISSYLSKAKIELDIQLQELEGIVTEQNHVIFQQAAREKGKLITKFLRVLEEYLDSTLEDFFRFIDQISVLMEDYDQTLEMFLEGSDTTLQNVQRCILTVGSLVERHGKTIQDLSVTSSMTNDLIREYHSNHNNRSKVNCALKAPLYSRLYSTTASAIGGVLYPGGSRNKSEILSQSQTKDETKNETETGSQTTSVLKTVTVTQIMKEDQIETQTQIRTETVTETKEALRTVTLSDVKTEIETMSEELSQITSLKINKNQIEHSDGQLKNIQVANNDFPMLIHLICDKLEGCNRFLKDLEESLQDQEVSTAICLDVYGDAQEEAGKITTCCKEIRGYALKTAVLRRKFLYRTEQIDERLETKQRHSFGMFSGIFGGGTKEQRER